MKLKFAVATERDDLGSMLAQSGSVEIVAALPDASALGTVVRRHRPDALLVDLGPDPAETLRHLEGLPLPRPALLVAGPDEGALIRRAMQLGAREYLTPGSDAKTDLVAALERLVQERLEVDTGPRLASVLAVMGAKGGVGTTFVACQLAAGLARRGGRVAIADMHLRLGDVALYFDLHPQYTIASLADAGSAIDAAFLQSVLATHPTGLQVLAAPESPEDADAISLHHTDQALAVLREEFDWVVVDTPRDFDDRSVHVLDCATQILIVTAADVPALNHARLQLQLLARLGHAGDKVRILVNRGDHKAPVQGQQIADFLHRDCHLFIPNDYPHASTCVNEGRALSDVAPRSALRASLDRLTAQVHEWCGIALAEEEEPRRGLRGLFQRRRHGAA